LSIGYFAGYFLLVFGVRPPKARNRPHPLVQFLNHVIVGCVFALAVTVPLFQVWKNLPQIRGSQAADAAFARLTSLAGGSLPKQPAVVLSDDPLRLLFLQHYFGHGPGSIKHLFLDTSALKRQGQSYIRSIDKENPDFSLATSLPSAVPDDRDLLNSLGFMGLQHEIYYIHPSFGYYFEHFYLEPHGLVYQLKEYATNSWRKPLLTPAQIEENRKIWEGITENELPVLTNLMAQPRRPISSPVLQYIMKSGHLTVESNKTAMTLGAYYAKSLDYLGAELEKAALLPEAGKCFAEALQFNPDSVSARINFHFNQDLQAGRKIVIEPPPAVRDQFGKYRGWQDLLGADGPFDDPSFCYVLGETFAGGGENYREGDPAARGAADFVQAIQQFERVRELAPDYANANEWLCKLYLRFGLNSEALTNAEQWLLRTPDDPKALLYKAGSLIQLTSYDKALEPLNRILALNPEDTNALFYKAGALMQLGSHDKALEPLNHLLTLQRTNYPALMERAICHLQLRDYPAAKADYEILAEAAPKYYKIDYGLQEVAYHQKDTNAIIKYCELYLTNYYRLFPTNSTPTESDEVKFIKQRLQESKNGAP
jgi:tetratricopeptide (TPR) repeat protein